MDNYAIHIKVSQEKLREILDRLTEAQRTILECYQRLHELGYLEWAEVEETASRED